MKTRQGFVSNSSSSSFILTMTNDTPNNIDIRNWWAKYGLDISKKALNFDIDDHDYDEEKDGPITLKMVGDLMGLNLEKPDLSNEDFTLRPNEQVSVTITTGNYESIEWYKLKPSYKIGNLTLSENRTDF
jgi:hypothetical protein